MCILYNQCICVYIVYLCIYIYPKHSNIGSPIAMISTENSGNIGWEYLEKKTVCFHKQLSIAKRGTYHKVGPLSSKLVQLQWTYICTNPSVEISTIKPAVSVVTKELLPILGKSPTDEIEFLWNTCTWKIWEQPWLVHDLGALWLHFLTSRLRLAFYSNSGQIRQGPAGNIWEHPSKFLSIWTIS